MDDVLSVIGQIMVDTTKRTVSISHEFGIQDTDHPVGGLSMCYNRAIITIEIIQVYNDWWSNPNPVEFRSMSTTQIIQLRQENAERVKMVGKSLFIDSLSSIEYSMKETCKTYHDILNIDFSRRQYLRNLISESHQAGLVNEKTRSRWHCLCELRNTLVHNNGISDIDLEMDFPTGEIVTMTKGTMTQGNLKFFPQLTCWAVGAYADWIASFLRRVNRS